VREGYRLNNPLRVGEVALESVASTSDPGIVIETIKPAESGHGVALRMYESLGRATTTSVRTSIPHSRAVATDLLERHIGEADLGALEFRPFEIKTVLLERP
jgi:alpha-mannosidase